jgi:hypothetical protein
MHTAKKVFAVIAVLDGLLIFLQAIGVLARIKAGWGH